MKYRTSTRILLYIIMALFFLGYIFRYLFISYYISEGLALPIEYQEWNGINQEPLTYAFIICTVIFSISIALLLINSKSTIVKIPVYKPVATFIIIILFSLIGISLILRYQYGAILGQDVALVGFFTGTLNYRMQADFLPALILLFMEIVWLAGQKGRYVIGMVLLAIFYISLSAITTSKAGMVFFLTQIMILMYLTGQSVWKYPVRVAVAALGGVLTFIIASQLRAEALGIGDSAIWVSLTDGKVIETLFQVVGLIANRIPGVEGLALTCGYSCDTLPTFQRLSLERGAVEIFTYDIVRVAGTADFRSPGLIGGAVILAGLYGGVVMVLVAISFAKSACYQMDKWQFSAATRAAFLFGTLRFMMEGAWYWIDVLSMLVGVAAIEIIARSWRVKFANFPTSTNQNQFADFYETRISYVKYK